MSFKRGVKSEALNARQKLLDSLEININNVFGASLEHKTNLITITKKDAATGIKDLHGFVCDGLITNEKNLFLFILTGDCLPLALFDPKTKTFALIHGSWDTLFAEILEKTILKLKKEFNVNPQNLLAKIGPSIGPCCYTQKNPKQKGKEKWLPFLKKKGNIFSIDLWSFTESELHSLGTPKQNIENPKVCTYHSGKYFSHRKYKDQNLENDYRFATILGIKQ